MVADANHHAAVSAVAEPIYFVLAVDGEELPLELPGALVARLQTQAMHKIMADTNQLNPAFQAMYFALKGLMGGGIPLFRNVISGLNKQFPDLRLPEMEKLPRHTDPIQFLLAYLLTAIPTLAARETWMVLADERGCITAARALNEGLPDAAVASVERVRQPSANL